MRVVRAGGQLPTVTANNQKVSQRVGRKCTGEPDQCRRIDRGLQPEFHLADNLSGQVLNGFEFRRSERLSSFGNEVRGV